MSRPILVQVSTLSETHMAPKNGWLEDQISFRDGLFSRAMLVSGVSSFGVCVCVCVCVCVSLFMFL